MNISLVAMSSGSSSSTRICHQFSLDEIKDARNHFGKSKLLGSGGEANVYLTKVYIEGEDIRVAVKHLFPGSNGFHKEIDTITKIQHPHIVSLLGYCEELGQKILVYEYMKYGTLSDYVKARSKICLSWQQRVNICLGAARGLQHLHTATKDFPFGIVHRDVKPGNILVDANWLGKISDFGLFKMSHADQTKSSMTTELKGTPGYYAPEYVRGGHVTRKVDVHAFGVVLFQVLCRKMPWDRGDESYYRKEDEDLGLWAQENVDIKIKREISVDSLKEFSDIVRKCLRKNPDERPTMENVVLDLEKVLKYQKDHQEARQLNDQPIGFLPMSSRSELEERSTHTHKLVQLESDRNFICDFCYTPGQGKGYRCQRLQCDFDLHEYCNTCPSSQLSFIHPHLLNLVASEEKEMLLFCNVCENPVEGKFYKCNINCDFDIHPLCTQFPQNLTHVLHPKHSLNLQTSTPSSSVCMVCGEECASWRYGCRVCSFNIHLECVSKGQSIIPNNNILVKSGGWINALMIRLGGAKVIVRSIAVGMLTAAIISASISGISPFIIGISGLGAWIIQEIWIYGLEIFYSVMRQKGRETANKKRQLFGVEKSTQHVLHLDHTP